jgi:electron-transferring-flavoprotein dehydrogenase
VGWPLDHQTYGGSFIYHLDDHQLAIGFIVGLDYQNPFLDPFEEFQRFKLHPAVKPLFKNAKRIGYGARSLCEGGLQSLPRLDFPGGLLIGDCAGFLNVPKIKGIHTAMKSGIVAAETLFHKTSACYQQNLEKTWLWDELYQARNIRPGFKAGLWPGLIHAAIDTYLFSGKAPWTLHHKMPDRLTFKKSQNAQVIHYPKPDQTVTFDKLSSLYLSNIHHEDNQPVHLLLKNPDPDLKTYGAPEQRYCPAKVYEVHEAKLHINAQNCIHCKACDIKDPFGNIQWTPPEGGSGPDFSGL